MEVKTIVEELREKGRVCVEEGSGKVIELIDPNHYESGKDSDEAVFLLVDIFQIRGIAGQFSEIALDIVEFATKPTVYTTLASKLLENGPVKDGRVKFSVFRNDIWNKIVFSFSRPLIYQEKNGADDVIKLKEKFPLFKSDVKRLFLSPDGDVKIGGE
ncbi:hypothetical protein [Echinicola sp. 20G]|uniref:hypothetical protein n=1 Tax=Echinicola sp. 20G TaxID=2781961 RepID=UPI001910FBF7|nr:hypothetical protein [Echinicola sp. 20G]